MTGSMTTWAKMLAAVTIVFAVFFIVPAVDAAACAPEPPAAHASVDHQPQDGDHGSAGDTHGICSHGHCHHGGSARPETAEALTVGFGRPPLDAVRHDAFLASITPEGLKRPPRN
ncbi:MAG: hypothetical protein K5831_10170 [Brevundimonas sp.]|uniref:hypothetical protein n=1 Tax=Brevundimonas sp. TaxID=1871086 RepID=UPI00258AF39D|nr:hypothetical protein [Brevundimonas sp.]MCV0415233.1 hypothetical protein [Brevundimonas sp.]